jgi:hypothetical protein
MHDDTKPFLNTDTPSTLYTSLAPYYKTTKGLLLEP